MPGTASRFYDVFLSYRHWDADRVDALKRTIEDLGFRVFLDKDIPELQDFDRVDRGKIEAIREAISRSTCLIFAYSRPPGETDEEVARSLGVWMPWELGFFDGSISARIGVYLLDGQPEDGDVETFRGSEYLGRYTPPLTEKNLKAFLARNAVRERRIDNVESAFVWIEHLVEESLSNPVNVGLGVAEWYADHAASNLAAIGATQGANWFRALKIGLDDLRMNLGPNLRLRAMDMLIESLHAQRQMAFETAVAVAKRAPRPQGGEAAGISNPWDDLPMALFSMMAPWRVFQGQPPAPPARPRKLVTLAPPTPG